MKNEFVYRIRVKMDGGDEEILEIAPEEIHWLREELDGILGFVAEFKAGDKIITSNLIASTDLKQLDSMVHFEELVEENYEKIDFDDERICNTLNYHRASVKYDDSDDRREKRLEDFFRQIENENYIYSVEGQYDLFYQLATGEYYAKVFDSFGRFLITAPDKEVIKALCSATEMRQIIKVLGLKVEASDDDIQHLSKTVFGEYSSYRESMEQMLGNDSYFNINNHHFYLSAL